MRESRFPPGWDEERVLRVIAHYEGLTEDEAAAEDELVFDEESDTVLRSQKRDHKH